MKLITLLVLVSLGQSYSQPSKTEPELRKHFVSTSLWSAANLFKDPADFYELNYGYRFTAKDVIILNATTWKYWEPLGIAYTNSKKYKHLEDYPGYVRAFGIGVGFVNFGIYF